MDEYTRLLQRIGPSIGLIRGHSGEIPTEEDEECFESSTKFHRDWRFELLLKRDLLRVESTTPHVQWDSFCHSVCKDSLRSDVVPASVLGPRGELHRSRLSMGCSLLDAFLQGGLLTNGITEICGESASGKTQFGLQLCFQSQLLSSFGGLEGRTLYVNSEGEFPWPRLEEIGRMYSLKHPDHRLPFMENIYVENVSSLEEMEGVLFNRLPLRVEKDAVRVVVIDSIASVVRHEFVELQSYRERAERLVAIAQHLKRLVDRHDLIVVVMNQVSDIISASDDSFGMKRSNGLVESDFRTHPSLSVPMEGNFPISWVRSDGKRSTASLGYVWAHCVTTRIALERVDLIELEGSSVRRFARVLLSPHLPLNEMAEFEIYEGGIRGKDRRRIDG
eukprot:TRINITY_DN10327_c0_g1_i1.p1 TRINITY_DN10327_c0_g1~~TRINITY_DN10327_c0_g1_i1.p1  ORF type:complete len:406 (-),score=106.53 TRINITY_DN10327_c0_g1_i1:54-1223(-)